MNLRETIYSKTRDRMEDSLRELSKVTGESEEDVTDYINGGNPGFSNSSKLKICKQLGLDLTEFSHELNSCDIVSNYRNENINGRALHSIVRIFNHDLDKIIEKLKRPESNNCHNLLDKDAMAIQDLGNKLCNNSDWNRIKNDKEIEFVNDLGELKKLILNLSNDLWIKAESE